MTEEELKFRDEYVAKWGYGPHYAADAIVVVNETKMLFIRRGKNPGKGKLALPGGFINPGETPYQAAVRELKEETGLDCVEHGVKVGLSRLTNKPLQIVMNDPGRDTTRGIVVSTVFGFAYFGDESVFKAADDADEICLIDLGEAEGMKDGMFLDHWEAIDTYLTLASFHGYF